MTKHYNAKDVETAFKRYVELTGDREARLERDGAYWKVRADGEYCVRGLEAYGLLHRYCDGYEDGLKAAGIARPLEELASGAT